MFGRGIEKSNHQTPDWIRKLVGQYVKGASVQWFPSKLSYGCACWQWKMIELHCPAEPTDDAKMVVLHEIAHLLSPGDSPDPETKRPSAHGIAFWTQAGKLYAEHGLLEYGAKHDRYVRGRRFLAKLAGR